MNNHLTKVVNEALSQHPSIMGRYLLSPSDIAKIIIKVIRILAVLTKPECEQCINELIAAAQSDAGGAPDQTGG